MSFSVYRALGKIIAKLAVLFIDHGRGVQCVESPDFVAGTQRHEGMLHEVVPRGKHFDKRRGSFEVLDSSIQGEARQRALLKKYLSVIALKSVVWSTHRCDAQMYRRAM